MNFNRGFVFCYFYICQSRVVVPPTKTILCVGNWKTGNVELLCVSRHREEYTHMCTRQCVYMCARQWNTQMAGLGCCSNSWVKQTEQNLIRKKKKNKKTEDDDARKVKKKRGSLWFYPSWHDNVGDI